VDIGDGSGERSWDTYDFFKNVSMALKNQVWTGKNIQLVLNSIFSQFIKLDISNWRIGKIEFR
jgi:hypothetical protein